MLDPPLAQRRGRRPAIRSRIVALRRPRGPIDRHAAPADDQHRAVAQRRGAGESARRQAAARRRTSARWRGRTVRSRPAPRQKPRAHLPGPRPRRPAPTHRPASPPRGTAVPSRATPPASIAPPPARSASPPRPPAAPPRPRPPPPRPATSASGSPHSTQFTGRRQRIVGASASFASFGQGYRLGKPLASAGERASDRSRRAMPLGRTHDPPKGSQIPIRPRSQGENMTRAILACAVPLRSARRVADVVRERRGHSAPSPASVDRRRRCARPALRR